MNTTTSLATSFTGSRGLRYPAPDVARGFMLLLIALANIGFWVSAPSDSQGRAVLSAADRTWGVLNALLIHQRAYPLFALLFGFGLATMINRRIASGTRAYCQGLTGGLRAPSAAEVDRAREQAIVDARRLVRRRGLWMVLFGLVHGIFFPSEIIGAYGIVAVVFAGWIARKHHKRQLTVCVLVLLIQVVPVILSMLSAPDAGAAASAAGSTVPAAAAPTESAESAESALSTLPWFVTNVGEWLSLAIGVARTTMVLPAAFLGARLADSGLIAHPERHRGPLAAAGIGGLALGALGALHEILAPLTGSQPWEIDPTLIMVLGLAGGCGWLAVLTLYAGGPTSDGRLTGLRWLLAGVGRRSMSAYLFQTLMFATMFVVMPRLTGTSLTLGPAAAAGVAAMVWLTIVGACAVMERLGMPGPFEILLRTAVARSERSRTTPLVERAPARNAAAPLVQSGNTTTLTAHAHAQAPGRHVLAGA
ncbi:DUF418 domain-containing protein [Actinomyces sp. ZJ308]|uniref:DUF418 domain-containing protein n=1 Tax=Actinomyces sp. ZJ308 TaxID=2708342 RepID=UPI00142209F1|nr:DUF418 domain-containing protein [Actinomyces sp. ZJ308]